MVNFFLGVVSIVVILPILEQIGNVICTIFEVARARLSLSITRINSKIEEAHQPEIKQSAIGFQVEEEYYEDD